MTPTRAVPYLAHAFAHGGVQFDRPSAASLVAPEHCRRLYRRTGAVASVRHHLSAKGVAMATGTVKWFDPVKGYGFIQPDDGSKDAFVHISAVERAGLSGLRRGSKGQL